MIVRRYMAWMRTAGPSARAEATAALARAYLRSELNPTERGEAEAALTLALDDREPAIRGALAEMLADQAQAPRHIILALATDCSDVATVVLRRSPLFSDAELIEFAATGDVPAQIAVACRSAVSAPVAAALAEVAEEPAALALLGNAEADLPAFSLTRIVERFGSNAAVRDAVLARPGTPVDVRYAVMLAERRAAATSDPERPGRREALAHEDDERVAVALAVACDDDDLATLVGHLRATGRLTAGLMLRALLSGDLRLPTAALANLAGMADRRAAALMVDPRAGGWRALYRKAGLPDSLMPAFASAVLNCREVMADFAGLGSGPVVARRIIGRVLTDREVLGAAGGERVLSVLRRFEVEIAREEARLAASMMLDTLAIEHRAPLALAAPVAVSGQFQQPVLATAQHDESAPSRVDAIRPIVMAALEDALLLRGSIVDAEASINRPRDESQPPAAAGVLDDHIATSDVAPAVEDLGPAPDKPIFTADPAEEIRSESALASLLQRRATDLEGRKGPSAEQDDLSDWAEDMIPAAANDQDPAPLTVEPPVEAACGEPDAPVMTVEARALLRIEEMVAQAYADARRQEQAA